MEILDICDENGLPTGETVSRDVAHRDGILHRTAHVWVVRQEKGVWQGLFQKRSMNKDSFPGMYDTSSGGHIPAGSEVLPSAIRELREELGIDAAPSQLLWAGTFLNEYEQVFYGRPFHDHEYTTVYIYDGLVDEKELVLQQSEVSDVHWFALDDVMEEIGHSRERFCVSQQGLAIARDYVMAHGKSAWAVR